MGGDRRQLSPVHIVAVSGNVARDSRIDALKSPPVDHDPDILEQARTRPAQPSFERRQGRHPARKDLHGPGAVNLSLHPSGHISPNIAARSGNDDSHGPVVLAQLKDVAGSLEDAQRGPAGALLIGSPSEVVDKILRHSEALGGVSRISFQMNVASLPQITMMRAIDAIGAAVAPVLHGATPASTTRE